MKIPQGKLKEMIKEALSESTQQSSLMDIASSIGRKTPGFVEILDIYYTVDGIIGDYLHEDGKAYQVYIKEKKTKSESPIENLNQFTPKETSVNLPKYRLNEAGNLVNKIFNNEQYSQADAIAYLKSELTPLASFVNITSGALGKESIMLLISFDKKENWSHGYVENSNYIRMRIEQNGTMEVFTKSLYKKGTGPGFENRLNVKFRKATAKSLEDAKNKVAKLIEIINQEYA